ncbi:hypothetical protein EN809_036475 [Mesorhizobium sp. M2E.F.Ca.ET.166.01.1.1]|nr:hypothetical protein EN809_036475 [Mesorhizobium sp. M2E.F.Ca.ET.166.01.1.1]TGV96839.1 hypothetical protein EN797_036180 [Mesorhizobium sp. M2E.F.Ca.ET.154.01.1.1]
MFRRNSGRKTATHFSWNCSYLTQFRTENRFTLFLELLQDHRHAGRRLAAGLWRWQIAAELIPSR